MAKFYGEFNGKPLWDEVNSARKVDGEKVSFENLELSEAEEIVKSFAIFHKEIPDIEKNKIIVHSLFEAAKSGPISDRSLEEALTKSENEYLKKKAAKFKMHTSISIFPGMILKPIRFGQCFIKIGAKFDKTVEQERQNAIKNGQHSGKPLPNSYSRVSIHVAARSELEAGETALKTINLVRGIFNLSLNRRHYWRNSFGSRKPVNKIQLGPYHTLHKLNGKIATLTYWYEPYYDRPISTISSNEEKRILERDSKHYFSMLGKSYYKEILVSAIVRYVEALDLLDWNKAFIQLWSVLEMLTDTQNAKYEQTIKRTAAIFRDYDYTKLVLNHLRIYRNMHVHQGYETDGVETLMYQMKRYVESLIDFHITSWKNFQSLNDVTMFLDMPIQVETLQKRKIVTGYAIKFHRTRSDK